MKSASVQWEKLNAIFQDASISEIFSFFESLKTAGADLDSLARSGKMLRDLHQSNTNDPERKISSGYGMLAAYAYIQLNLMGPALAALDALKSLGASKERLNFVELAISKKFSKEGSSPVELLEPVSEEAQISADDLERDFNEFFQTEGSGPVDLNTPLFSQLDSKQSLEIIRTTEFKQFQEGDCVFKEGDAAQSLYIVSEGQFELRTTSGVKKEFKVGDFFGEIALVAKLKRTGEVVAKTSGALVEISKDKMIELFIRFPEIETEVLRLYYLRLFKNLASRIEVFQSASEEEIEEFFYSFRPETKPKGEVLFPENADGTSLYFLISGTVQLMKGKTLLESIQMGQFFGETSILGNTKRSASAVAKTKVDYLICDEFMLKSLFKSFPRLQEFLGRLSRHRTQKSSRQSA